MKQTGISGKWIEGKNTIKVNVPVMLLSKTERISPTSLFLIFQVMAKLRKMQNLL